MFVETPFDIPEAARPDGEAAKEEALGRFIRGGSGAFSDNTSGALQRLVNAERRGRGGDYGLRCARQVVSEAHGAPCQV